MGNRLHIKEAESKVFDCQRKIAFVFETIRSIENRYFQNDRYPNLEYDCLIEAGESLKAVYETLRDLNNRTPWETGETVERDAA